MPGAILDTRATLVNKIDKNLCPFRVYLQILEIKKLNSMLTPYKDPYPS